MRLVSGSNRRPFRKRDIGISCDSRVEDDRDPHRPQNQHAPCRFPRPQPRGALREHSALHIRRGTAATRSQQSSPAALTGLFVQRERGMVERSSQISVGPADRSLRSGRAIAYSPAPSNSPPGRIPRRGFFAVDNRKRGVRAGVGLIRPHQQVLGFLAAFAPIGAVIEVDVMGGFRRHEPHVLAAGRTGRFSGGRRGRIGFVSVRHGDWPWIDRSQAQNNKIEGRRVPQKKSGDSPAIPRPGHTQAFHSSRPSCSRVALQRIAPARG